MTHVLRPVASRGTTLLESMVALSILAFGILGMMQLQLLGISSNAGARSHTQAYQLARELASALEQLPPGDPLLTPHFDAETPPAAFGRIVVAPETMTSAGYAAWSDSMATSLPGVETNVSLFRTGGHDPNNSALPRFQRRWQVWQMSTASAASGVKAIAVSVTYREQKLPGLREVVLLTQVSNKGLSSAFAAAYR